jgi:hypothetical protein
MLVMIDLPKSCAEPSSAASRTISRTSESVLKR